MNPAILILLFASFGLTVHHKQREVELRKKLDELARKRLQVEKLPEPKRCLGVDGRAWVVYGHDDVSCDEVTK